MLKSIRGKYNISIADVGVRVLLPAAAGAAILLFYRIIKNMDAKIQQFEHSLTKSEGKTEKAIQQCREGLRTIEEERKLSEEKLGVESSVAATEATGKSDGHMKEVNAKTSSVQSFVEPSRKELCDSFVGIRTERKTGEELWLQLEKLRVEFTEAVTEVTEKTEGFIKEVNTNSTRLESLVKTTKKELSDSFVGATTEINTTMKEISLTVKENSQNCLELKENDLEITKQFDAMKMFVSKVLAGSMTSGSAGSEPPISVSNMSGTNLETSSYFMKNTLNSRRARQRGQFSRS